MNQPPRKPADDGRAEHLGEDTTQNPRADQLGTADDEAVARGVERQERTRDAENADRGGRPSPDTVDVERE